MAGEEPPFVVEETPESKPFAAKTPMEKLATVVIVIIAVALIILVRWAPMQPREPEPPLEQSQMTQDILKALATYQQEDESPSRISNIEARQHPKRK